MHMNFQSSLRRNYYLQTCLIIVLGFLKLEECKLDKTRETFRFQILENLTVKFV